MLKRKLLKNVLDKKIYTKQHQNNMSCIKQMYVNTRYMRGTLKNSNDIKISWVDLALRSF